MFINNQDQGRETHLVYRSQEVEVSEEPDHLTGHLTLHPPVTRQVGVPEHLGRGGLSLLSPGHVWVNTCSRDQIWRSYNLGVILLVTKQEGGQFTDIVLVHSAVQFFIFQKLNE